MPVTFTQTLVILIGIDLFGIIVGLISIYLIQARREQIGGKVGKALNLFVLGISFQVLAFIWTLVFHRLMLLPVPALDIHNLLMAIGMILFVWAARKTTQIAQL